MNNQFTQRVSDIIQYSKEEACRLHNSKVGPEHLLLGIIRNGEGKAFDILRSLYVDLTRVKGKLETLLKEEAEKESFQEETVEFTDKASRILKMSLLEARLMRTTQTDSEHVLLAIMRDNQNRASKLLEENEVTYQKIVDKLIPKAEPQGGLDFGEEEEEEEY